MPHPEMEKKFSQTPIIKQMSENLDIFLKCPNRLNFLQGAEAAHRKGPGITFREGSQKRPIGWPIGGPTGIHELPREGCGVGGDRQN